MEPVSNLTAVGFRLGNAARLRPSPYSMIRRRAGLIWCHGLGLILLVFARVTVLQARW